MILWCAYCQRFLGEAPPFERKEFTHGMCSRCFSNGLKINPDSRARLSFLQELQERFWKAGHEGDLQTIRILAEEGIGAGVRPIDILLGFAGPLLVKVGDLWAKGALTVKEEHRFTRSCELLVTAVSSQIDDTFHSGDSNVLLACVPGNEHRLGLHFVRLALAGARVNAQIFEPASTDQLLELALERNCRTIGLSISMESQKEATELWLKEISKREFNGRIVLGGGFILKGGQLMIPENLRVSMAGPDFFELTPGPFGPADTA